MGATKRILLWLMSAFYVFAGVMHFVNPGFYEPMMPPYLPWHSELILISGIAEVVLGAAVLVPSTRNLAAWGIIALLIAVLPANLHIALNNIPIGEATEGLGAWNWIRPPFQVVLMAWAYWYTDRFSRENARPA